MSDHLTSLMLNTNLQLPLARTIMLKMSPNNFSQLVNTCNVMVTSGCIWRISIRRWRQLQAHRIMFIGSAVGRNVNDRPILLNLGMHDV